jgi:hypothetical protein
MESEEWNKWKSTYVDKVLPIIKVKCLKCHEGEDSEGEFDISKFPDGESAVDAGDIWERVAKRVRLNEMPPPKSPGLNDREKSTFHRWVDSRPGQDLCSKLASDETQSWYRGHVMSRRLSQYEYANAIRDLTGYQVPSEFLPPADGAGGEGFDTVGDSLFTSPIHLESYLRVANQAIDHLLVESGSVEESLQRIEADHAAIQLVVPKSSSESDLDAAASQTIASFARRAWRRPIQSEEIDRLRKLFIQAREEGGKYSVALRQPIKAILLSPHFLFLAEPEPEQSGVQRLTPHQFATRMSLLVWSSLPDRELLDLADNGMIFQPDTIRQQLGRMLGDPRSRAIGENFGLQWLGLRDLPQSKPDHELFPDFDQEFLRDSVEETIQFVSSLFREGRPLTDLLVSDYAIVNDRLATHYGFRSISAPGWHRVSLVTEQEKRRGGVMTMASVLLKTSYPRRTSPVLRGRWILEEILGSKVPPPPPNVPALQEPEHSKESTTLRQQLELHRQKAECASCHDRMDPIGFGLENFDVIGGWRTDDNGSPIDAEGVLPSGEKFVGPGELKQILLKRKDEFFGHFTRKFVGFALGRELNKFDQCIIDKSIKRLQEEDSATVILEEILMSYPFQNRYYNPAKSKS